MKQFEDGKKDHAEQQLKNIQELDKQLGQSQLLEKWDMDDLVPDPLPDEQVPVFKEEDSRPLMSNMIVE